MPLVDAAGERRDLGALLRSRIPIVVIETRDEDRARDAVLDIARSRTPPLPVFEWAVTGGLRRADLDVGPAQRFHQGPEGVLQFVRDGLAGLYVLLDFHPYLRQPVTVRLLKDIAQAHDDVHRTVVLISHEVELPAELEHLAARLTLAFPTREERRAIVDEVAREWATTHGMLVRADETSIGLLVENLAGLSVADTRRLARAAVHDDGAITRSDVPAVMRAKYELLSRGGVLTYEYDTAAPSDLAGLDRLTTWLSRRMPAFDGSAAALDPPRGVLLLGVQGCGKSLAAKVAAGIFGVPLLRLDLGAIGDKYVGESERRLRESLATADVMAPCVVWVDEIEKGLATSDGDTGTSQRVLGTFLTWLAEHRSRVFLVATANDISRLPPELMRKGRFDEIFFVDLPDTAARARILRVHAARRDVVLSDEEVTALAAACDGFSGAEIEQAVVSAAYAAHAEGGVVPAVQARHVEAELRATRPLSVVMAEQVAALRAWAAGRTVPAA
ncbi:AAA family ATPase [Actinotalea ferrariae]|uniref:AAA family ATPase n=1 Tax=Actinotalea ferrariae TaxID=1386098 RepID=UPI001C8B1786|nr:AAA family ATPase [Actinotalea ferrariae]MBX9246595.1 AAA family ATPase [Actinotalea ferrariae]